MLSQRLQNPEPEVAALVANQRDEAVSEWEELVKTLEVRGKKLEAAGEIHKFNRDIAEALLRIQEKNSALGNDVGKDIKSTQKLLRMQEVFDNDLLALHNQLEELSEDSGKLQVWSLSSFKVSRQLLTNDLNHAFHLTTTWFLGTFRE